MTKMFRRHRSPLLIAISAAVVAVVSLMPRDASAQTSPTSTSAASKPTSAPAGRTVGWRGDGAGRYPDATPPTEWYLKENGESKNILWKTKLPCYSWATPIIVGDKIITRSEPYDLICLDKNTGKLLWIRSHPPIIAVTDEQKAANPAFREVDPLLDDLQKVNDEFVAAGWSKELYKKKYDLQKKINELTAKADQAYKMPKDMYVESWSGYTGSTPCSDGRFIYFNSGAGIIACYDLDGNRKWQRYESLSAGWGEHGSAVSPALIGDKLINGVSALSTKDGQEIWRATLGKVQSGGSYAAVPFKVNGQDFVAIANQFIRASDGKNLFNAQLFPGTAPIAIGGDVYFIRMTWLTSGFHCELADGELKVTEMKPVKLPQHKDPDRKWDPMADFYTAGPLYVDGLLYVLSNWGRFSAVDMNKGELVYSLNAPFDFKNPPGRKSTGMGIGASPALAGKYIYMTDSAGCTLVVEPGREFKLIAKNNIDYTVPEGWEPSHWMGPHHEQTEASPVFDAGRLYIRGEQFLYCIGEK